MPANCNKIQEDTTRTPPERPKDPLGDPQETPGEDQEAPRNTAGHSKASQMIPKRLSGASQKPLLERCILHAGEVGGPYESIANSIQNWPCFDAEGLQTTHRRPQNAFWRRPSTQKSSHETTKLLLGPYKRYPRHTSTLQGPTSRAPGDT